MGDSEVGAGAAFLAASLPDAPLSNTVGQALGPADPAAPRDANRDLSWSRTPDARVDEPGGYIGPYKLLQRIGEGGFGSVYVAEQTAPLRRRVALKIIKLGMSTREVVARFEQERQALALMDHPNIARVFDGGATESGRPFFVMELVSGVPVTEFCDTHRLRIRERLELFGSICGAVQHAHQKGVIHRDIKPSNILAAMLDGRPHAKVIDFGVAKAVCERLTDKTLFTKFHQIVGTPQYMSPEQADGSVDIDTRSDVYSLGVLLYELLTGSTPFDVRQMRSIGEIQRTLRQVEPPRPSTRVQSAWRAVRGSNSGRSAANLEATADGSSIQTIARHRRTHPINLARQVRGELDWIVMKALEKDRAGRYESCSALAADVDRYLRAEPVTAGRPSRWYRLRKLAARNMAVTAMLIALLTALSVGLTGTLLGLRRAQASRKIAETNAAKSQQVSRFLQEMISGINPGVAKGRDTSLLQEILNRATERFGELKDQPDVEAELRIALADAFASISKFPEAEQMLERARELARSTHGVESREYATAMNALGRIKQAQADFAGAEALYDEAYAIRMRLFGEYDIDTIGSRYDQARLRWQRGDLTAAEADMREAVMWFEKLLGPDHPDTLEASDNLADLLQRLGRSAEAEAMLRTALAETEQAHGPDHPRLVTLLRILAGVLVNRHDVDAARGVARQALERGIRVFGREHLTTVENQISLASILAASGGADEAIDLARDAVDLSKKIGGDHTVLYANAIGTLGLALQNKGDYEAAEPWFQEMLRVVRGLFAGDSVRVADALAALATVQSERQNPAAAAPNFREAIAIYRKTSPQDHPALAIHCHSFGEVLRELALKRIEAGDSAGAASPAAESVDVLREALRIRERQYGDAERVLYPTRLALAMSLVTKGLSLPVDASSAEVAATFAEFREAEVLLRRVEQATAERATGMAGSIRAEAHENALTWLARLHDRWDSLDPAAGHAQAAAQWRSKRTSARP